MDIKIIEEKENPLLERKTITAEINFEKETPNRMEIKEKIAAKTGSKKELTIIRKIENLFGKQSAIVKAHIYNSKEEMDKIETKEMIKRNTEKPKEDKGE